MKKCLFHLIQKTTVKWKRPLFVCFLDFFTYERCFQSWGNYQQIKRGRTKCIRLLIELHQMERGLSAAVKHLSSSWKPNDCVAVLTEHSVGVHIWQMKLPVKSLTLRENKLSLHNNALRAGLCFQNLLNPAFSQITIFMGFTYMAEGRLQLMEFSLICVALNGNCM